MLETDRAIGNNWLVTGGLKDGDRVTLDGLQKIRPGMLVKGVQEQTPAGAASPGGRGRRKEFKRKHPERARDRRQASAAGNRTQAAGSAGGKQ